ncbi:MAG: mechanosensitive ion channel [Chloroflexi bacterium]|nr:mechanosensitive ion channel [Chloroflexota bacterium]
MGETIDFLRNLAVTYGLRVLGSVTMVVIGRWVARLLVNGLRQVLRRARVDATLISFFGNILYYLLLAIILVAALNNLGVTTTSAVAILGAATLAVGLALQDSLGNLASGVMLILLRTYRAGDYVIINDREGFVTEIHLFHTLLTTRDNKAVFIPNKDVMDSSIVNYSRTELIRLELVYGIGYGDDLLKAKRILREIAEADERVAKEPPPVVAVKELAESSVNLVVRPYVRVADEVSVTFSINEQVKLSFDQEGVTFPFPQQDVHLYQAN